MWNTLGVIVFSGWFGMAVWTSAARQVWQTNGALWAEAVSRPRASARAWTNYGNAMAYAGRADEAGRAYAAALAATARDNHRGFVPVILRNAALVSSAHREGRRLMDDELMSLQTGSVNPLMIQGVGTQ